MRTQTVWELVREDWRSLIPAVLGAIALCLAGWGLTILAFCFGKP